MSNPAVLFDLDGTLADTVPLIAEHIAATITDFGVPTEPMVVFAYIGRSLELTLAELSGFGAEDPRIAEMVTTYHKRWYEAIDGQGPELLLPGVHPMLLRLRDAGLRIGVVTAKTTPEADHLLKIIGIRNDVDVLVGTELVDRGKPAPDGAWLALELLGAQADGTWYVGDASSDMEMALAAGMRAMGITTGAAPREALVQAGAETVVERAEEVADLILNGSTAG